MYMMCNKAASPLNIIIYILWHAIYLDMFVIKKHCFEEYPVKPI